MTSPAAGEPPSVVADRRQLQEVVARLAAEISDVYTDGAVLVGVLNGSVVFLADLVRSLRFTPEIDFLALSSFQPGGPRVRLVKDLDTDIGGRHVLVVEDVVDTGLTLTWLLGELGRREPASLSVCTLLDKSARRLVPVPLRFVGLEVPDVYLLGYGLDHQGRYRNLDRLVAGDLHALAGDPDAHVEALYRARPGVPTPPRSG